MKGSSRVLADFAAGMVVATGFALVVVLLPVAAAVDTWLMLRERRRVT